MQESRTIDFGRLLGFGTVSDRTSEDIDFRDETISDKLGAKVGPPEPIGPVKRGAESAVGDERSK